MSEEEIVKIVDTFLDGYRQYNVETGETYIPYKYGEGQKFCYVEDFEAIQGLLDLYNKEKEKNKTLETLLQGNLFEMYKYYKELSSSYQANSISKDKIKEKIEELKNEKVKYIEKQVIQGRIDLLEELLKGE